MAAAPPVAATSPLPGPLESPPLRDQDTNKTRVIKTIIEEVAPDGRVLSSMVESETKRQYY
ncbi:keratin 10 [Rhinolophus ferrumequinum]|uniref:Keratin 10 n=1 Tax=Rhinolophus ferrumequinum TaxID=59479 RepID=A0A7J7TEB1_RHIFE|nr:keratin 10 [Rhinolophus ferrumequinum]